jgi:hypothetical protein
MKMKMQLSLQHYELGLQKAEHNMRKMNMSATQAISKTTRSEETITTLQADVKQLRDQIARLEQTSQQQTTTHETIIYPAITRLTLIETEIAKRPTKKELQDAVHSQVHQRAQALEATFEENMTRTAVQNNLNIGMTMYSALSTNRNNANIQEWSSNNT